MNQIFHFIFKNFHYEVIFKLKTFFEFFKYQANKALVYFYD